MRNYEALFIIRPDLESEQIDAVVEKFTKLLQDNGAEITNLDKWGKRRLAYLVKNYREGIYVLLQFKSEPAASQELERVFKITDDIIRFLVTRMDEDEAV